MDAQDRMPPDTRPPDTRPSSRKPVFDAVRYGDPADIPDGALGLCDDLLIRPRRDSPDVLIHFNGAVNQQTRTEPFVFQRWSWARHFAATVVWVQDPLATLGADCGLAWYVGSRDGDGLSHQLARLTPVLDAVRPGARRVCFGSSGGGFAALMSAALGWSSLSLAINPQTDLRQYMPGKVDLFLRAYGVARDDLAPADLDRMALSRRLASATPADIGRMVLFQNLDDKHHYNRHFLPLARTMAAADAEMSARIAFQLYSDPDSGHNPPPEARTLAFIRGAAPELMV